jgi:uncharacterized protein involved in outer membrane biogenesis
VTEYQVLPDQHDRARHRQRALALRWIARIALAAVALVFALWLVLFITKGRFLRSTFERIAAADLHRPVTVGGEFNLYFDPIDVAFRADGLRVGNVAWVPQTDFLDARHIALRLRTFPLLWGQHKIAVADIDGAHVDLQWDDAHQRNTWTFASDAPAKPLELPDIERGLITDTHIAYADPQAHIAFNADVDPVTAAHSHIDQALGFSGTGTLRQHPVRFSGAVDQPEQALRAGSSGVVLHAEGANTTIDLTGRMPGISNIDDGRYHLAIRGANMADLFDFMGVVVVPTRRYHLVTELDREHGDWVFTGIKGVFGDSDLAGRLAVGTRNDRLHLDADLRTASLDLIDAAPFLGYDPQRLDRMGTKGMVTKEQGHPRILPDAPLRSAELQRFDADARYRVGVIAGKDFPVGQIDLTLRLDHGLLTLKPVTAVVATGHLDSAFVLDTRGPVVKTDYMLHLLPTPMGKLLARFGVSESGTSGTLSARIAMRGLGNSLRESLGHSNGRMVAIIPAGTMWTRNVVLSDLDIGTFAERMFQKKLKDPIAINCGLVAFTVKDGISAADPILIDTQKNIITGTGDFSFRDESVDLQVRAKSKRFSLFSLQSPIGVGGWLAQPHLKLISSQLLARLGAAGALGVVATPVAALAAFVDPGDGKATACGPVLAGDRADAQHTTAGKPITNLGKRSH